MQPTGEWLNQPGGLAERLAFLRKAAGLTGERMAADLGWPRTKVSKIENGRQMPTAGDITGWAAECGREDLAAGLLETLTEAESVHRQYRHQVSRGHAAIQDDLNELVRQAKRIRNFEVLVVPGLLQTADYSRYRMLEAVRLRGFPEDGVEPAVAARMRRQGILYDATRSFEFIVTEAALRFLLCPAAVMLGQLDRLMSVAGLGNITLAVIPMGVELSVAPMQAFLIADDVTYLETPSAEDYLHGPEAETYQRMADGLLTESVTGDDARRLLLAAAAALRET